MPSAKSTAAVAWMAVESKAGRGSRSGSRIRHSSVQPRINLDYTTTYRNDGNNVDIEKEMVDASKNGMRYNSAVSSISQNFKVLKMIMRPA